MSKPSSPQQADMDASFRTRSVKCVNRVCYGQQGKEISIKQPPINVAKVAVTLVPVYLVLHCLYRCVKFKSLVDELLPGDLTSKIFVAALGVCAAAALTTVIFGCQIQSESLVFISSVGVNVKMKNWFGQVTAEFFEINEIKDIVILEAITMQKVVCYLAVVLEEGGSSSERLYPLFMKSSPDLETLKVIYRDVHQLLQENSSS
ncbi:uncharacterized protein LOC110461482 [Mizuhopecten yessoensis]|uniref:uncharacterized protein LOC110461482 n=1 Tax=Mizuhopecten yessoensis TaxID=6573 RepID=UPI000B45C7C8|nr:uncharacterized protein LOC110461482 [Mizuhopecten yessoensis]